jgi:hypothetical protein
MDEEFTVAGLELGCAGEDRWDRPGAGGTFGTVQNTPVLGTLTGDMSTGSAPSPFEATPGAAAGPAELVPRTPPLHPEERAQMDRAARRLHGELGALLSALPPEARHASGLARQLKIDRTTCQRVVFLASRPYPGLEALERFPGVRALRSIEAAAGAADPDIDEGVLAAFGAAIRQFHETVSSLGGSLSRLCRRLAAEAAPAAQRPSDPAGGSARRTLFDAASQVTGRASDCWVAVYIYRPSPEAPDVLEVFRANGLRGHRSRRDAVPLVVHNFSSNSGSDGRFQGLRQDGSEAAPATVVLEDFTSEPRPLVTARQPGEFFVQSVDTPATGTGAPVDLMLATRSTLAHPAKQQPALEEVWAMVNFPSRHLLLDVYLHPDLARTSVPSLDAHLWGPDFSQEVGNRWRTRFSEAPPLQLLGNGIRRPGPEAFAELPALTEQLFERADIDPEPYVGYRCDVAYPLWRTGYCISFAF